MSKQIDLNEKQIKLFKEISLFNGINERSRESLPEELSYTAYAIKNNENVIEQGNYCQHLLILIEGQLQVLMTDVNGFKVKIEEICAPRTFATPHLFGNNTVYPATFKAIGDGILIKVPKQVAFDLISREPLLLKNFLKIVGNCNNCTLVRVRILSYKNIRSRFAYYLLQHKQSSDIVLMEHNQTQLAEYLCVSRPALANEIRKMVSEDILNISGKTVKLINVNILMNYL